MLSRGFTTIELIVGILIVGLLLAVGFPVLTRQRARQALQGQVDTLVADLRLAHSSSTLSSLDMDLVAQAVVSASDVVVGQQITPQPQHLLSGVTSYSVVTSDARGNGLNSLRSQNLNPDLTINIAGDLLGGNLPQQLPDPAARSALLLGTDGICFQRNGQLSGPATNQVQMKVANGANSFLITVSHNGAVTVAQVQ